jgi:agmatine/peptidylarginine deiminase
LNELILGGPRIALDIVNATIDHIPLLAIVASEDQRIQILSHLCDWGIPAHLIHFACMPLKGMWVRDYGPAFVRWCDGQITILDADYDQADRRNEDYVPTAMGVLLRVPVVRVPLSIEGGNLLGNGEGFCLSTTRLIDRNQRRNYDAAQLQSILENYYGYYQGALLTPLQGETTGHVDMFAAFVSPTTVVVGSYERSIDPVNAEILDDNARRLEQLRTRSGPLRVVRIPMPENSDGFFRSYTNVIFANSTLLVPTYPGTDRALERKALGTYAELLPDRRIIPIDVGLLVPARGALHCISINVPWLNGHFSIPARPPLPEMTAA